MNWSPGCEDGGALVNTTGCHRCEKVGSRREFLTRSGLGFGALGLTYLLDKEAAFGSLLEGETFSGSSPLAAKAAHFSAKAKSVIFIFLQGGACHIDMFDPKPLLKRLDGQTPPPSFLKETEGLQFDRIKISRAKLMASAFGFNRYGESGLEISDLFRNVAAYADDLAVIRSCYHESFFHGPALNQLYTGSFLDGHPSIGSWVLYGLGSESDVLPAFMVMTDGSFRTNNKSFQSGFLPALYQGTWIYTAGAAINNLAPPPQMDETDQRLMLNQMQQWNQRHWESRRDDNRLSARIANYELAFRMQTAAPELIDISNEPKHIRQMYGMDNGTTAKFGRICLLARRMVERGVRFIQLNSTDWDGHGECDKNHWGNARKIDKPIAGLIGDLKQRGLLDSTLLVLTGEFGRTPAMEGNKGRDHHPYGFSTVMAGGGIRGGQVIGATDELGYRAVEDRVHVHDLHATMLSLLGLDHRKLTYFFQGRDRRLTDVGGDNDLAPRLIRMS